MWKIVFGVVFRSTAAAPRSGPEEVPKVFEEKLALFLNSEKKPIVTVARVKAKDESSVEAGTFSTRTEFQVRLQRRRSPTFRNSWRTEDKVERPAGWRVPKSNRARYNPSQERSGKTPHKSQSENHETIFQAPQDHIQRPL
jgi:hypothetical protein